MARLIRGRARAIALAIAVAVAVAAVIVIGYALYQLRQGYADVAISTAAIEGTPVTIFRPPKDKLAPVVVIAHGFAGSQQLMQSFALTLAGNGYIAVTFDFPGHGRNPKPLTGSITDEAGATRVLVDETSRVAAFARGLGDGRLAVLGHSMASDIVVRFAEATPDVAATIAVSMFSPAVTATSPKNLLVIVGDWEGMLKTEALRAVGLATVPAPAEPEHTYGDFAAGTARRAAFSPHVEHASVLFSEASEREALAWLDQTFGIARAGGPVLDGRGPWIMALVVGIVVLAWPLSGCLPQVAEPPAGAGLGWRRLTLPLLLPMILVPLVLRVVPTHFLPMLVGDYLAVHFAAYGVVTAAAIVAADRRGPAPATIVSPLALAFATAAVCLFFLAGFIVPINMFVTSFVPGPNRVALIGVLCVGTLSYFLADEWLTRGVGAARAGYPASKLAFLVSLGLAIALDFERLFFLIIIVPVILVFFVIFGIFSRWIYGRTGHPFVAAIANALLIGWAIGVTFPLLAG